MVDARDRAIREGCGVSVVDLQRMRISPCGMNVQCVLLFGLLRHVLGEICQCTRCDMTIADLVAQPTGRGQVKEVHVDQQVVVGCGSYLTLY